MQPRMSAAEITQIELQLAGRDSLLQFGCGNATLVAARQVRKIVMVDADGKTTEIETDDLPPPPPPASPAPPVPPPPPGGR